MSCSKSVSTYVENNLDESIPPCLTPLDMVKFTPLNANPLPLVPKYTHTYTYLNSVAAIYNITIT